MGRGTFHGMYHGRPPAQGFQTHNATAGIQIQKPGAGQAVAQNAKQAFAHKGRGGPNGFAFGAVDLAAPKPSSRNANHPTQETPGLTLGNGTGCRFQGRHRLIIQKNLLNFAIFGNKYHIRHRSNFKGFYNHLLIWPGMLDINGYHR